MNPSSLEHDYSQVDSNLVRCDSLDAGSACGKEVMTPNDLMTLDPVGRDPGPCLAEPSAAELAQCEAEVGTLLSIIAELNKKMGALKAPSEPADLKPAGPSRPLGAALLTPGPVSCSPDRNTASSTTSKPPVTNRGGSGAVWSKLQQVLSAVEDSISCRRSWAVPITASDQDKQTEHLAAAQDSWVQATQILEEMEREFGISYPSGLPTEERQQYQRDILDLHKRNSALRGTLQRHQQELDGAQSAISQMEEERDKLQEKLVGLHKAWRSGSLSSSSGSASGGALSPGWASPPVPCSPLLLRRTGRALSPLSSGGDVSPSASISSASASLGSPCPSPISLEGETERLNRCIERLKARNERLTAALERRKGESEQISMTLSRHEADCSALQMALRYCEECEEAYSELLLLHEAEKQQSIPLRTDSAEPVSDRPQPGSPSAQLRNLGTEELSTSFSTAGGAEEVETQSHTGQRPSELVGREAALRQQIECLKRDRAAVCLPKPGPGGEGKLSPDTGTLAGPRGGRGAKHNTHPPDTKKEKAALLLELITVREEMSELRGLIRLTEKERRCLDWSLMAQKAQDAAGALLSESFREALQDDKTEQQRLSENAAKLAGDADIPGPRNRTVLRELQAVLQREQALKRRLALVRDSLDTSVSDSASRRRDSGEQIARLTQAHSKATGSYRNARRKYREQAWRLEQRVAAMSESHQSQIGALKATLEALEWKREETVL
ncbi:colorectal mutant cancer protein isoform X2 [Centroberyx affinis]|uniref:colorectal mutant cancer protein isoform X2 n=1 Tax=Centroberyx affinis TaxID=166261 RepID=UPI003A5B9F0F